MIDRTLDLLKAPKNYLRCQIGSKRNKLIQFIIGNFSLRNELITLTRCGIIINVLQVKGINENTQAIIYIHCVTYLFFKFITM